MADGSQENQELITALHLFTTSNMCELVGITLLAYDHLLTLSGEIRFVWDRKFSGATVIFVLNRYVNLFSKIVLPISTFWWPNQTDKVLGSSIALDSLTESDVDVVAVQLQYSDQNASANLDSSRLRQSSPLYEFTNMYHYIRSVAATFDYPLYGCGEDVALTPKQLQHCVTLQATLLALNVADLIVLRTNVLFDPLPVFIDVFTCILISRFMLNLRQVAEIGSGNPSSTLRTSEPLSRMSTVHFAANLVGDLGSPLVHGGWKPALHDEYPDTRSYVDSDDDLEFSRDALTGGWESPLNTLAPDSTEPGTDALSTRDRHSRQRSRKCQLVLGVERTELIILQWVQTLLMICKCSGTITVLYFTCLSITLTLCIALTWVQRRLGGVGISAFDRQQQSQRSFAELSSEISQAQVDLLHAQLAQFRSALAHYASTHRDRIRKEPSSDMPSNKCVQRS
ncbi:hypothetical protein NUW54_g8980 [Trametes sanguinea]|uniref:Uncharacterized protein n=1 Tax=Trametes sanguinea TaxID=158606 RepID=A0ACC1P9J3_9APHY|nr:hypothetical protein NUW54_g8980 [Trametes sanguinea]